MINSPLIKACSQERNDLTHYYKYVFVIFFSPHSLSGLHSWICKHLHTNPLWDSFPCLVCRAVTAEMMDHIIRLEESKDSQQLDLQFTAFSMYEPFLHERDNWAVVTESVIVFF